MSDWLTSTTPPIADPITGRATLGDLTRPEQALAQFYRAFNGRDLAGLAASWEASGEAVMDSPLESHNYTIHGSASIVALDLAIRL
jgi:hypothetical protein